MARVRARDPPVGDDLRADAPPRTGADYRNRIWTVAGEVPVRRAPVARDGGRGGARRAASRRRPTCSRPAPACSRSTCAATATGGRASMLQEPATFGAEVEPHHVMAAAGLVPADAHRELRPQTVSTGLADADRARAQRGARSRVPRRTSPWSRRCSPSCERREPLPRLVRRRGRRAGADVHAAASRAGRTRPPARRPGRCAPICTRTAAASRVEISQGVEMRPPEHARRRDRRRPRARQRRGRGR